MNPTSRWLEQESATWVERGWMTEESAQALRTHYSQSATHSAEPPNSRMLAIFSVLGGLSISLGVILLFAHNWDDLSRTWRAAICLTFLFSTQALSFFALFRRADRPAWTHATSVAQFVAVGAAIALVSQTYHFPGSLEGFTKTWLMLGLPLLYLFRNPLCGVAYYMLLLTWAPSVRLEEISVAWVWLLTLGPAPYLVRFFGKGATNAMDALLLWSFAIATPLAFVMAMSAGKSELHLTLGLAGLAGAFYFAGCRTDVDGTPLARRPLRFMGSAYLVCVGLAFSVKGVWRESSDLFAFSSATTLVWVGGGLALIVALRSVHYFKSTLPHRGLIHLMPILYFAVSIVVDLSGWRSAGVVFSSLIVLAVGVAASAVGIRESNLGRTNLGMLCIIAIISIRFVDDGWSFVARGIGFIVLGSLFLASNLMLLKRQRKELGA